ncbi:MAG: hypothetical protein ABIG44_01960, partial [Planctomycetota bacterium]
PGQWDYDESAEAQRPTGRQHMVSYSYMGTSSGNPANPGTVEFAEYFQRREGVSSVQLPEDIWVAPVEALDTDSNIDWLAGVPGVFTLDAANPDPEFRQADDFLLTFDPQTGLRRGGDQWPIRLKAYDPVRDIESDRYGTELFQRYSSSGIVLYRRELLLALENEGAVERQEWLRRAGRPYLVHRFSGGLVMGTQGSD